MDFFLVHDTIFQYVTHADTVPGYRTGHSAITLKLKLHEGEIVKGYWKFNNSLLKDMKFVEEIKNVIQEVKQTYATNMQNDISGEDILFIINDLLFLETLLMMVRGCTIEYSSVKKKKITRRRKTT